MEAMISFLKKLGFSENDWTEVGQTLVVDIEDSDQWDRIKSIIEHKANSVELEEESSIINENNSSMRYTGPLYDVTLIADFKNDIYRLTVLEN